MPSDANPTGTGIVYVPTLGAVIGLLKTSVSGHHSTVQLGVPTIMADPNGLVYKLTEGGFVTIAPGPMLNGALSVTMSMGGTPGYLEGTQSQNMTLAEAQALYTHLGDVITNVSP